MTWCCRLSQRPKPSFGPQTRDLAASAAEEAAGTQTLYAGLRLPARRPAWDPGGRSSSGQLCSAHKEIRSCCFKGMDPS